MPSSSDLTPDNVQAVFLDSLATSEEPDEMVIRAEGIKDTFRFQAERLYSHVLDVELMLSHASAFFYDDRGGGHTYLDLGFRRDGHRWGGREDCSRLLALGLAMNLILYCMKDRAQWVLFPGTIPYIRIKGRLFKLWANFESATGATLTVSFEPDSYKPPTGIDETSWYGANKIKVRKMGENPRHVAEAFYQDLVVLGFFEKELPSWILDQETSLQVY